MKEEFEHMLELVRSDCVTAPRLSTRSCWSATGQGESHPGLRSLAKGWSSCTQPERLLQNQGLPCDDTVGLLLTAVMICGDISRSGKWSGLLLVWLFSQKRHSSECCIILISIVLFFFFFSFLRLWIITIVYVSSNINYWVGKQIVFTEQHL